MSVEKPRKNDSDPRLDDNDPVWKLLGELPPEEPSPWFAARTVARIRSENATARATRYSFLRIWRWSLGTGLGLCLAMVVMTPHRVLPPLASNTEQENVQEAFEIVASANPDTDASSSSLSWQDTSL